jgi:hypothetical protein
MIAQETHQADRKAYHQPLLVEYGSLDTLTLNLGGNITDNHAIKESSAPVW